jgi:hypothetical protein
MLICRCNTVDRRDVLCGGGQSGPSPIMPGLNSMLRYMPLFRKMRFNRV